MDYREYIMADPNIMLGKPVIRGTRITVEFIIQQLAQGASTEDLLKDYPGLTKEQIQACLAYSFEVISAETLLAG
jgi:uncharacterized protein (DUF433 family)